MSEASRSLGGEWFGPQMGGVIVGARPHWLSAPASWGVVARVHPFPDIMKLNRRTTGQTQRLAGPSLIPPQRTA